MKSLLRWFPALLIMAVIFAFSSTPSTELPNLGWWDTLVKKGGHVTGYGLLALAYWFGLNRKEEPSNRPYLLAWVMAVLYAISDEIHQSFTPGRHPSPVDVALFDAGGAALALFLLATWLKPKKQPKAGPRPL